MKSMYAKDTLQELLGRIDKLQPDSQRQWGKMNVSQMLEHCCMPLEVALGDKHLSPSFMVRLLGPMMKGFMTKPKPFPKNIGTAKEFLPTPSPDFAENKKHLVALIQRFFEDGGKGIASRRHPVFGRLTAEEWSAMNYKHLDHHLRQFGA